MIRNTTMQLADVTTDSFDTTVLGADKPVLVAGGHPVATLTAPRKRADILKALSSWL
jgi:hypothetical protein